VAWSRSDPGRPVRLRHYVAGASARVRHARSARGDEAGRGHDGVARFAVRGMYAVVRSCIAKRRARSFILEPAWSLTGGIMTDRSGAAFTICANAGRIMTGSVTLGDSAGADVE